LISTGTVLGIATIPMVGLTALSVVSAICLIIGGEADLVANGAAAAGALFAFASMLLREDDLIANRAHRAITSNQKPLAYFLACLSSGIVPLVVLVFNVIILQSYIGSGSNYPVLAWLWSYGVATGAWSLRAHLAAGRQRTLSSIQAYAAHVGYFSASVAVLLFRTSIEIGVILITIAQILPFAIGFFLAMADRSALRDVQI